MIKLKLHRWIGAMCAAGLVLGSIGVAAADQVVNNIDATVDATHEAMALTVGGSNGSTTMRIVKENDDGKNGCNLTGSTTLKVSVSSGDTTKATVSPTELTFDSCDATRTVTVTPVAAGSSTITLSQTSNTTDGSFDLAPASFQVNVAAASDPCAGRNSPSAPTIAEPNRSTKVNGWYGGASDAASFTVTPAADAQYSLDGGTTWTAYSSAVTLVSDGAHAVIARNVLPATSTCVLVTGAATLPTVLKIDRTAPGATPANVVDTTWRNTDLSQEFTFSDSGSGLAANQGLSATGTKTLTASAESASATAPTVVSTTVSDLAGNSVTRSVSALIDKTRPIITPTARNPLTNGFGWHNTAVDISWSCSDLLSGVPAGGGTTTVNKATEGANQTATGTCYDKAGNSSSDTQNDIDIDLTAPVITKTSRTAANADGWNNGPVTVTWSCSDGLSTAVATSDTETVSTDGAGQSASGECVDVAGNTATALEPGINIDTAAPTITPTARNPLTNGFGWHSTAVDISWSCSDLLSGVPAGGGTTTVNKATEGANQTATGTCYDKAGNSSSDTQNDIDIDLTAPGIVWSGSISDHFFGSTPAALTCTATDGLSGPNGCVVSGHGTAVGTHTLTGTARDLAGNTRIETQSYTVKAWTLSGFYQPVDMSVTNTVKAGASVPLKFEAFAGTNELTDLATVASFKVGQISCGSTAAATDDIEQYTSGGTTLRYDSTGGQFIQNWQVPKVAANTCYRVTLTLADGTSATANFKTK